MKLELKHLAPYLPYGLKIANIGTNIIREFTYELQTPSDIKRKVSIQLLLSTNHINKPILRPLSDLMEEIEGKEALIYIIGSNTISQGVKNLPYYKIVILLKNHYDIFGLIEKGLAIDINTIKK